MPEKKRMNPHEGASPAVDASGVPRRSLDDIWNAVMDIKALIEKTDTARENDRLRNKLRNEGKVR